MLKAMGFSDAFLRRIILEQAMLLSCGGFLVGAAITILVDGYVARQTFLAVELSAASAGFIFLMATAMSVGAGLIALRRVSAADPADLY